MLQGSAAASAETHGLDRNLITALNTAMQTLQNLLKYVSERFRGSKDRFAQRRIHLARRCLLVLVFLAFLLSLTRTLLFLHGSSAQEIHQSSKTVTSARIAQDRYPRTLNFLADLTYVNVRYFLFDLMTLTG